MLPESWQSRNFRFDRLRLEEAAIAKSIYDSNAHLSRVDPHFGEFPITEFEAHIQNDQTDTAKDDSPKFYLSCIRDKVTLEPLGYFQFEMDTPEPDQCWLPMFVLTPSAQGEGVAREALTSLINVVLGIKNISSIGLNVYAENKRAFQFWVRQGWREILAVEVEQTDKQDYTCLTLIRRFHHLHQGASSHD